MKPLMFALPGNEQMAGALARKLGGEVGQLSLRRFPDGETLVRIDTPIEGREVILVCTLVRPDDKVMPLLLAADTARDLGAHNIGLVAPYLAYLRQDQRFHPGEGITSAYFARIVSAHFDWLVTVDPHLHRYHDLNEIYTIPTEVVHSTQPIAAWIRSNVETPLIIGPDGESEQWVSAVAREVDAPYIVLNKTRKGDRDVGITVPDLRQWSQHTPVLVDDIISTARTMIRVADELKQRGVTNLVCIGVHAIFADQAYAELKAVGANRIVTTNTISHESNGIDMAPALAGVLHNRSQ